VSFLTVFLAVQILINSSSLILLHFEGFFMLLDRKFNEDSKNVVKIVIFSLQVGFSGNFVAECHL